MRLRVVDYRTPIAKEEDMSSKMDKTAKIRRTCNAVIPDSLQQGDLALLLNLR